MALIPLRPLMEAAEKHNYAQGACNVNSDAQAKAAIEIHELFRSPAIMQGADLANGFMGGRTDFQNATLEDKRRGAKVIADAVRKYGSRAAVPVVLHLDHGRDFDSCVAAIDAGYTSVMIDGSSLPLEENIELTREVVRYAHPRGVSVEGELGVLGGVEDHVFSETSSYTNPLDAVAFIQKTSVDALAISYGTMHGPAKGKNVRLRKEIVIAIKECLNRLGVFCALVSHGSSTVPQYIVEEINALGGDIRDAHGISVRELQAAIPCGIRKINVDTDIRLAVTRNMKELFAALPRLQESPSVGGVYQLLESQKTAFDPRVFFPPVMDAVITGNLAGDDVRLLMQSVEKGVKEAAGTLIVQFGSYGKSGLVPKTGLEEMKAFYRD